MNGAPRGNGLGVLAAGARDYAAEQWVAHRRRVLIQIGLSALSIAILVWRVDLGEAFDRLGRVDLRWALPGLAMFTVSKAIHAYRWRSFLVHRKLAFGPLFGIFLASNAVNALVPLRAGDLLRIELASRRFRVPRAELASSVIVVESALDGVAFVLLLGVAVLALGESEAIGPVALGFAGLAVAALALSAMLARAEPSGHPDGWPWRWLPGPVAERFARWAPEFIEGMRSLREPRRAAFVVGVSLAAWLAEVPVYWMMGRALGIEFGLGEALIVMIAANLIVSVPLTPWDVGPYEIAVTETIALTGIGRAAASSFAVGSHLLLVAWVAITGVAAMWSLDVRPRDVMPGVDGEDEESAAGG